MSADSDGDVAVLRVYGAIGDFGEDGDATADDMARALSAMKGAREVRLQINCPGGDPFEAFAMNQQLARFQGTVSVRVDGLCASAATILAMAAHRGKLGIATAGMMMIHNAAAGTLGDKNAHRKTVEILTRLDNTIARCYADRTGRPISQWLAAMDSETWLSSQEAVNCGLADFTF
jgi:ATP-dependent Clp protease protease subunit